MGEAADTKLMLLTCRLLVAQCATPQMKGMELHARLDRGRRASRDSSTLLKEPRAWGIRVHYCQCHAAGNQYGVPLCRLAYGADGAVYDATLLVEAAAQPHDGTETSQYAQKRRRGRIHEIPTCTGLQAVNGTQGKANYNLRTGTAFKTTYTSLKARLRRCP